MKHEDRQKAFDLDLEQLVSAFFIYGEHSSFGIKLDPGKLNESLQMAENLLERFKQVWGPK